MKEINEEIKQTINLIQSDIDDGAHDELQYHLACLLEIKRNELQQRLVERSRSDHADGMGSVVTHDQAPYKSVKLDGQVADEAKPLTVDELKAGGWWFDEVRSHSLQELFREYDVNITGVSKGWFGASEVASCVISSSDYGRDLSGFKQIHRIGNDFYWGEV